MTTTESHPTHYAADRCLKVTLAAEKLLDELSSRPSEILDGLATRSRPGDKQRAREAYELMLRQIHELRTVVELSRPLEVVTA